MQFLLMREGAAKPLDAPPAALPADGLLWIDCHYDEARAWVSMVESLTDAVIFEDHLRDAENPDHPSFFESTHDYELVVFRGLAARTPGSVASTPLRIHTRPTVFFLFPGCLVTVRSPESHTVPALRARLLAAGRQRIPQSSEELMLRLLNGMVDRYLEFRQPLGEQLERWQRRLLDPRQPFRDWYPLLELRTELGKLEQLCEEQLDAMQEWLDERLEVDAAIDVASVQLPDILQVRANDIVNHIERVLSHSRRMQDSVASAVQLHFSSTSHRTNEIMRTLTTISAVFMPLTLITGIFGMNFDFIPGLHARAGFWIAIVAMALIAIGLLIWFRARRYLSSSTLRAAQAGRRSQHPPGSPPA